jgi:adenylyltransferase/sulfurtransferase
MPYPPLVEPAAPLTPEELGRYARHVLLPQIGMEGQRRLRAASVLVIGAGGLGSPVLTYLAAAGIGSLTIVDDDVVEDSNLQRQVIHGVGDIGRLKVESAAYTLAAIAPGVELVPVVERFTPETAAGLLTGHDLVVDGSDNFPTRYAANDACARAGIPLVWGSILGVAGQVSVWWAGQGPCYRCVFPDPPPPGSVPSCGEAGVLGALCGVIGSLMATQVVQLVTGTGEPLVGRVLVHDASRSTFDTLLVRANPSCPVCGTPTAPTGTPPTPLPQPYAGPPPTTIPEIGATDLAAALGGPNPPLVVDVRPLVEQTIAALPGYVAVHLDEFRSGAAFDRSELADRHREMVLVCRSGARSAEATRLALAAGYTGAVNLRGGVLAWAHDVDPSLPTY